MKTKNRIWIFAIFIVVSSAFIIISQNIKRNVFKILNIFYNQKKINPFPLRFCHLILACFVLLKTTSGQNLERQVFSSGGTHIKSGNIWLDYTIGEMSVSAYTNGSIVLNQGFHQVYSSTISVLNLSISSEIKVFPNPSRGFLEIDIPDEMTNTSSYKLTDIAGRVILNHDNTNTLLQNNINTLDIANLPYGIYLLSIQSQYSNRIYIYRILKL